MYDHTHTTDAPMSPARMQVRFGPRTVLVERFLLRLSKLPVATWLAAGAMFDALSTGRGNTDEAAAWAEADRALCQAMDEQESARNRVSRRVVHTASATKGIVPRKAYESVLRAALTAVFAIIVRDQIGPQAFQLLYAPFEASIPFGELEAPAE